MGVRNLRRVGVLVLVVAVAAAAWLLPRHPLASGALILGVAAVGVAQWRVNAAMRLVREAGLRCDVERLAELATAGSLFARLQARVALIHHGGEDSGGVAFCTCGTCEKDILDAEIEDLRRIVRLSWSGFGEKAYELAREQALVDQSVKAPYRELLSQLRLVTRFVSYAAVASERPRDAASPDERPEWFGMVLAHVESFSPALLWPSRLAAAREAASRGDRDGVRRLLEGMPSWPSGSPLEAARRGLLSPDASVRESMTEPGP